jgi:hypothetical protein
MTLRGHDAWPREQPADVRRATSRPRAETKLKSVKGALERARNGAIGLFADPDLADHPDLAEQLKRACLETGMLAAGKEV